MHSVRKLLTLVISVCVCVCVRAHTDWSVDEGSAPNEALDFVVGRMQRDRGLTDTAASKGRVLRSVFALLCAWMCA